MVRIQLYDYFGYVTQDFFRSIKIGSLVAAYIPGQANYVVGNIIDIEDFYGRMHVKVNHPHCRE
jgi:hypothetical protein